MLAGLLLGNLRELLDTCKQSIEILAKNTNYLDNVLETLDVQQHSMGVLFVLVAKFGNVSVGGGRKKQDFAAY